MILMMNGGINRTRDVVKDMKLKIQLILVEMYIEMRKKHSGMIV
jgi:hypothetical protein